jgi:nucleotide-binding universal stress UspA family protein
MIMSTSPLSIGHILCPTDFSELSRQAVKFAVDFCESYKANMHLLHVVDEGYQYWMAVGPEGVPVGPAPEELLGAAKAQMQEFQRLHLANVSCPVQAEVVFGQPYVEICEYASQHSIDLIVIATHGRGALTSALLGSTTDRVVHRAPCPVLTVREKITGSRGGEGGEG